MRYTLWPCDLPLLAGWAMMGPLGPQAKSKCNACLSTEKKDENYEEEQVVSSG